MTRWNQPSGPLQGGTKRKLGWDGPTLAGPRGTRRRLRRRLAAAGAGVVAAIAVWLTVGAGETRDAPMKTAGVVPPGMTPQRGGEGGGGGGQPEADGSPAAVALGPEDTLGIELEDEPAAGLLFDADSGEVLWRLRPRAELPIASLTKIMTALLVVEDGGRPGELVEIDRHTSGLEASGGILGSAVGLEPGMRVEEGALFEAMLMSSANDAATALAADVAGTPERFVAKMNERARRLGLDCTRFVTPYGLEPENRSCAADLAVLTNLALDEPRIPRIAGQERTVVDFPIRGGKRHLATTNPLLQEGYEGTIGLKTGYTEEAGQCLAAVVRRDGRTLVAILLDSPDPAAQAEKLLDAGFGQAQTSSRVSSPPGSKREAPADGAAPARRGST